MAKPLLIHVGYAKAASTWLQAHLFNNQSLGFQMPFRNHSVGRQFRQLSPFEFDAAQCRNNFLPELQCVNLSDGFPVVSCEGLTGPSRVGGYQQVAIADRLAEIFPDAKILLVLREQKSMLLAQYHQYLRRGGSWSLRSFLDPPICDGHRIPYFDWGRFQYHHLLEYYQQLFGCENVLALPLELLSQSPEEFVTGIADFCGLSVDSLQINALPVSSRQRTSQSSFVMNLRRPLNLLFGERTSFNPSPLLPVKGSKARFNRWSRFLDARLPLALKQSYHKRAEAILSTTVVDYYEMSNRRLCQLTGYDLEKFGYEVALPDSDSPQSSATLLPEEIRQTQQGVAAA